MSLLSLERGAPSKKSIFVCAGSRCFEPCQYALHATNMKLSRRCGGKRGQRLGPADVLEATPTRKPGESDLNESLKNTGLGRLTAHASDC